MSVILLAAVVLLDGSFAGFRAGLGRDGRVDHRADSIRHSVLGGCVVLLLALPLLLLVMGDGRWSTWSGAASRMDLVFVPYAVLVVLAIAAYSVLPWRLRFLAMAVVLGPFTLLRPAVAVAGAVAAAWPARDGVVWAASAYAVVVALMVEPLLGRWHGRRSARRAQISLHEQV